MTEADELGNDLLRASARLTRWASRNASFAVPMAQARLLALVDELGPARVSSLARADHSSQPTMTSQLNRLEAAGWVHRLPDPGDARACLVSLTDKGAAALQQARNARLAALSPALDALDPATVARLRTAVEVLDELLERAAETSLPPAREED